MGISFPMDHHDNMNVKITAAAKALPQYHRPTSEIIPMIEVWLDGQDERFVRKAIKIFENAGVDKRYSIMSPEEVFLKNSFEERNDIYVREGIKLSTEVLVKALDKAAWDPQSLDYIITVSCTGIMIPSIDAFIINELGLRQDIVRLPVTEMGCAAGVSGIIYAKNFLQANPGKRAAVVSFESPTATFQLDDYSMANIVSAAIFGDGAACVLLSSREEDSGPYIVGQEMYHFPNSTYLMGFKWVKTGLQMVLDPEVPAEIAAHFEEIVHPFLEKHGSHIDKVNHLIFHPGGRKIMQTVDEIFGNMGKNIDETREVLRLYGNMSSATVLYVLEQFLDKQIPQGDQGLMLSFGPGFSAQRILIQW